MKLVNKNLSVINYQPEIDCLRAVAVFFVILFHFELFNLTGGFIGVDVFFVISGYLITSLVIKDIINNKFSFVDFYLRRIRRIIPNLYFVIFLTLILSYFILSPDHFNRISKSSVAATTAYSNFFFWSEAGYFDLDKFFKPLLHTWSLSIELQLYVIWPILLVIIFKFFRNKIKLLIIITILLSLFLSTIYSHRATGFFYFTLFRMFEFGIGSLTYLIKKDIKIKQNDTIFLIGLLVLIFSSFIFTENSIFPGSNALLPCIGTSLILLTAGKIISFKKFFINKFVIFLGKISYSLYLIHWPIVVFYRYIKLEPLIFFEKILLILITIAISSFTYKFVETPFRSRINSRYLINSKNIIFILFLSLLTILVTSKYLVSTNKFLSLDEKKQSTINKLNQELQIKRDYENEVYNKIKNKDYFKKNDKHIKVLVWGDSHASDLYLALKLNDEFSKLDLAYLPYDYFYCFKDVNFKDKIVQFIKENIQLNQKNICQEKIESFKLGYDILYKSDFTILANRWPKNIDFKKIKNFINDYNSNKILIFGKKPEFFHIPTLYIKSKGDLNKLAYLNKGTLTNKINDEIKNKSEENNLIYFNIEELTCSNNKCEVIDDNNLLISDEDHWSFQGLKFFGKKLVINNFFQIIVKNSQ